MNIGGWLKYHEEPKLTWKKCPDCKENKIPRSMHAYWHSIKNKKSIFDGLNYKCKCGFSLTYNPTFDITFCTHGKQEK